jgi:2-methylcitrate dehydratase PrpD
MTQTLARTFADFAARTSYADIPPNVRRAAELHILDTVGVCIAGAAPTEESGQAVRKIAEKWKGKEGATVFGIGVQCRAAMSALINGTLAQALEMDDKHGSSLARPGATVVPAVLAVAEEEGRSIRDVITAIAVGYDVMIRLGFVASKRFLERGYHTSSLIGGFGTAAAIGRLRGCSADQIADALGIAGTMASGIQEATRTGDTSKILHGGWGAHSGIIAIDLATAGISGPESVFEGKMGFFETHLTPIEGQLDWATPVTDLGTRWYLPETAFKPYPCCQLIHAFIEGCKEILVELARDSVPVDKIERIVCKLAEPGLTLVTDPVERKREPQTVHEARFSLQFSVASALVYGDVGLDSFSRDRLDDARVLKLAARVDSEPDPDSDYPKHCPARIEIVANGKTYRRHIPFHPGCPEAPLSRSDVLDKFARNSKWLFGEGAHDAGEAILALRDTAPLADLARELQRRAMPDRVKAEVEL